MISDELLKAQLGRTLAHVDFPELGAHYEGKVRDNYTTGQGQSKTRTIVVSDRLSAFDVVLGTIPFKGQVLNQLAAYWFDETKHLAPNHVIDVPDPNVTRAVECKPLPVEMVVRSYLTGVTSTSIWRHYEKGSRLYAGHELPDGMRKNQRLPTPLVTPSTKAEKGEHDETDSRAQLIERGLVDAGRTPEGEIVFIDEIHTPDSSRYWYADDYEARLEKGEEPRSLDKEYVRRYFAGIGYTGEGTPPPIPDEVRIEAARRYIAAYEQVTGRSFVPDTADPIPRIRKNLGIK